MLLHQHGAFLRKMLRWKASMHAHLQDDLGWISRSELVLPPGWMAARGATMCRIVSSNLINPGSVNAWTTSFETSI